MSENAVPNAAVDFSHYVVVFAGDVAQCVDAIGAVAEIGAKVRVVTAEAGAAGSLAGIPLDELVLAEDAGELAHEAFRRCASANLLVLAGDPEGALEVVLRPILEEDAAAALNPVLPLVRLDDPSLRDLNTAARWGYFLIGRALGLPPARAREFMEECCGYENKNQASE